MLGAAAAAPSLEVQRRRGEAERVGRGDDKLFAEAPRVGAVHRVEEQHPAHGAAAGREDPPDGDVTARRVAAEDESAHVRRRRSTRLAEPRGEGAVDDELEHRVEGAGDGRVVGQHREGRRAGEADHDGATRGHGGAQVRVGLRRDLAAEPGDEEDDWKGGSEASRGRKVDAGVPRVEAEGDGAAG